MGWFAVARLLTVGARPVPLAVSLSPAVDCEPGGADADANGPDRRRQPKHFRQQSATLPRTCVRLTGVPPRQPLPLKCISATSSFPLSPPPFPSAVRRPFILGLTDGQWVATITHHFMSMCHEKGLLLRLFTQNIDGLDFQVGGRPLLPPCHRWPVLTSAQGSPLPLACPCRSDVHPRGEDCLRPRDHGPGGVRVLRRRVSHQRVYRAGALSMAGRAQSSSLHLGVPALLTVPLLSSLFPLCLGPHTNQGHLPDRCRRAAGINAHPLQIVWPRGGQACDCPVRRQPRAQVKEAAGRREATAHRRARAGTGTSTGHTRFSSSLANRPAGSSNASRRTRRKQICSSFAARL